MPQDAATRHGEGLGIIGTDIIEDPDTESRERTWEIYRAHLRFAGMIGAGVVGTETYANPRSVFSRPAPEDEDAFRRLIFTSDLRQGYNPSFASVWLSVNGQIVEAKGGAYTAL